MKRPTIVAHHRHRSITRRFTMPHQRNAWSAYPGAEQVELPAALPSDALELWAYANALSYAPGDTAHVHVHSTAPQFDVRVTRDGATPFVLFERRNVTATPQRTRENPNVDGCGWNVAFALPIPPDAPSGVYVLALTARVADRTIRFLWRRRKRAR